MHQKHLVNKNNELFVEHYVIKDAIDGSETYYEKLNIKNCWKYFPEIAAYIYGGKNLYADQP